MPEAGRLGDQAHVPSDSHGSVCCAHSCIGPATSGSGDVLINGRPALRIDDQGVHSSCCGGNTWVAVAGAPAVLINDRKAHRLNDATQHCGGAGKLVEGSPDVIIGDGGGGAQQLGRYDQAFYLKYDDTGEPVANRRFRIIREDGSVIEGTTDDQGRTQTVESQQSERVRIEVIDE